MARSVASRQERAALALRLSGQADQGCQVENCPPSRPPRGSVKQGGHGLNNHLLATHILRFHFNSEVSRGNANRVGIDQDSVVLAGADGNRPGNIRADTGQFHESDGFRWDPAFMPSHNFLCCFPELIGSVGQAERRQHSAHG